MRTWTLGNQSGGKMAGLMQILQIPADKYMNTITVLLENLDWIMNLTEYFGRNITDVLLQLKKSNETISYAKIAHSEFVELPESGYYLQAKYGTGVISVFRLYFCAYNEFFPADISTRGEFGDLFTLKDFEERFGAAVKDVRAFKMPGAEPTLPGKLFKIEGKKITAYSSDGTTVAYIHVKST